MSISVMTFTISVEQGAVTQKSEISNRVVLRSKKQSHPEESRRETGKDNNGNGAKIGEEIFLTDPEKPVAWAKPGTLIS